MIPKIISSNKELLFAVGMLFALFCGIIAVPVVSSGPGKYNRDNQIALQIAAAVTRYTYEIHHSPDLSLPLLPVLRGKNESGIVFLDSEQAKSLLQDKEGYLIDSFGERFQIEISATWVNVVGARGHARISLPLDLGGDD